MGIIGHACRSSVLWKPVHVSNPLVVPIRFKVPSAVYMHFLPFLQKQLEAGEVEIRQLSADLAAANQLLGNDLAEKNKDLRIKLQEAQLALDTVSSTAWSHDGKCTVDVRITAGQGTKLQEVVLDIGWWPARGIRIGS